ncbi:MAG: RidA family protein [Chitinophagaceae bacterium]
MKGQIRYMNPATLHNNPAFSQIAITEGSGKTVYIGGQNAVNAKGEVIGKGDIAAQTEQAMQNVQTALEHSGAGWENVVKLSIYILQGQDHLKGFQASRKFMQSSTNQPTVTVLFVARLGNPDFLLEIEAIAFIPA